MVCKQDTPWIARDLPAPKAGARDPVPCMCRLLRNDVLSRMEQVHGLHQQRPGGQVREPAVVAPTTRFSRLGRAFDTPPVSHHAGTTLVRSEVVHWGFC